MLPFLARLLNAHDHGVDAATVLGASTLLSHVTLQGVALWHGEVFNAQSFGTGAGAIIAALAAAGWFRKPPTPTDQGGPVNA
jgi:hypothetical protein